MEQFLIDFRIWNVNASAYKPQKVNVVEDKFLSKRLEKYADVRENRIGEKDSIFLELNGSQHFRGDGSILPNLWTKHELFKKWGLNV